MKITVQELETDDINLAPLIDCVFLLLIFFMVATSFDHSKDKSNEVQELLIQLPKAQSGNDSNSNSRALVIRVNRFGKTTLDGTSLGVAELRQALKKAAGSYPDARVHIEADAQIRHQQIVHILDVCQFVGLNNIGIRVQ